MASLLAEQTLCGRGSTDFNHSWEFLLSKDLKDAEEIPNHNAPFRAVKLPHDWSVEFPFDEVNGEGCTGFLPGGMGWYRKNFKLSLQPDERAYIYFDGVYNRSEHWINGRKLGYHPYGYSPFYWDITNYLNDENQFIVKVDRTRLADSRWYTGSGIYRDVKLVVENNLHIPKWGTFITTPSVNTDQSSVVIKVEVENHFESSQEFDLVAEIHDSNGNKITSIQKSIRGQIPGNASYSLETKIDHPDLWTLASPTLYSLTTKIVKAEKCIDQNTDRFGIRSFKFDANSGFFLNGKNMKIKGVCLHHDGGLVGAAVPNGVWKRRFATLKELGCNAIRISHNPGSQEFLDLCDEMGFLVQEEFFDEWDYPKDKRLNCWERHDDYASRGYSEQFAEWAERDLKSTMRSHRNHPSIIQWSIGNEIEWTFPRNRPATGFFDNMSWEGNYFFSQPPFEKEKIRQVYNSLPAEQFQIENTAKKLAKWTREMDTTRPVIANCILPSASFETGYSDVLDIVGFSYRRVMYDYAKQHYPNKVVMGTENLPQWHEWKAVIERPFVSGLFLWTGIDHMGEMHDQWPQKTGSRGVIDQAGFKKPAFHMFKSLWNEEPHVFICSQAEKDSRYQRDASGEVVEREPGAWKELTWDWPDLQEHWNYQKGEAVIVEVYSNCEQVELFQDGTSLGLKLLADFPDRVYRWATSFEAGELTAQGTSNGEVVSYNIRTAKEPVDINVSIQNSQLNSDSMDVSHVVCQLIDENGTPVKHVNHPLEIDVEGPIKYLGGDNGWPRNTQAYQSNILTTHNGRMLFIVQAGSEVGRGSVTIKCPAVSAEKTFDMSIVLGK